MGLRAEVPGGWASPRTRDKGTRGQGPAVGLCDGEQEWPGQEEDREVTQERASLEGEQLALSDPGAGGDGH